MAIARFDIEGTEIWGQFVGDDALSSLRRGEVTPLDEQFSKWDNAPAFGETAGETARLLAPIGFYARIFCIGLNYRAHAAEANLPEPNHPVVFLRTRESLVAAGEPMVCPRASDKFDWEGELAVVIGNPGRHIDASSAMDYVLGYTSLNDGSVRDWQKHTSQFGPGKNFDKSGAIGSWIVERDDAPSLEEMRLTTRLNGDVVQDSVVSDQIFSVPRLIAYLSTFTELRPGDIVATGTPAGVGSARKPQVFMGAGDKIEIAITGLPILSNAIIAE